jgi:hypothetical protein
MRLIVGLVLAAWLGAQEQAPPGLVRGKLESRAGTLTSGELSIRSADGLLWLCSYNDKTYIERERLRIAAPSLKPGDSIEMVTSRSSGPCYARTVHILTDLPPSMPSSAQRARLRAGRPAWESIAPRGNLTFAGIVLRLDATSMLLRTRFDGQKTVLLRQDTGFAGSGRTVDSSELRVNTRVFVRAGRNPWGDLEAYQVVWGEILPGR